MSGGGSKPGERRGGRKKGTPNKTTGLAREAFRKLAHDVAIPALERIARSGSTDAAVVAASKEILDRAFGKAPQPMSGEGGEGDAVIRVITGVDRD